MHTNVTSTEVSCLNAPQSPISALMVHAGWRTKRQKASAKLQPMRKPEIHEVILDQADGLDWETLCKCDVVYAVPKTELVNLRGTVTVECRRAIAERVIRGLGLAGL